MPNTFRTVKDPKLGKKTHIDRIHTFRHSATEVYNLPRALEWRDPRHHSIECPIFRPRPNYPFSSEKHKYFIPYLPPVHTYPMKTVTKNANFWKHCFRVLVWTPETDELFENDNVRQEVEFSPLRMHLLQYSTWLIYRQSSTMRMRFSNYIVGLAILSGAHAL